MKKSLLLVLFLSSILSVFGSHKIDVFLLSRNEYKGLESGTKLIDRAIANAFGVSKEDNEYKFNINFVD